MISFCQLIQKVRTKWEIDKSLFLYFNFALVSHIYGNPILLLFHILLLLTFTFLLIFHLLVITPIFLTLLARGKLILPLPPIISDGIDSQRKQQKYVAPHHLPQIIVQLQKHLVLSLRILLHHLVVSVHLHKSVNQQNANAN